jgi:hypothetical protein
MTMSVKFQIMLCPCASDIIKVTYNHVNSMRKLVRSSTVLDLLDKAFIAFNKVCVSLLNNRSNSLFYSYSNTNE